MDWAGIREKAMEPASNASCGHGGCGLRHEVYVEMEGVSGYFHGPTGKGVEPLHQTVPADTLRQARTSPTCANIIWQQSSSLNQRFKKTLPPIPRHRLRRLLVVPEFRAVLGCNGNRPCHSTLAKLGAVSYNLFTNVAVKPSRDLSAFFVHRVKELGFQAGEQYLVGIQIRLGLIEDFNFLGDLTVADVCKVNDVVVSTCVSALYVTPCGLPRGIWHAYSVQSFWTAALQMCHRLECAYGRRPLGCAYVVATDTPSVFDELLAVAGNTSVVKRANEGEFFHLSNPVSVSSMCFGSCSVYLM